MNELKEYQDVVQRLQVLKEVVPTQEFRGHFDHRLVASLPDRNRVRIPLFGYPVRFAVILLAVLLLGGTGLVVASENAQPGSPLYPVKNVVSEAKSAVMSNPVIKSVFPFVNDGQKQLKTDAEEHGSTSQREVTTNPGKLRLEMKRSQKNTVESSDEVNQSLPQNTQQLQQLRITVPTQAQPALEKAIESSQNGKEHSQEASQNNQSSSSVQGASNAQESNKSENASQGLDNSQQGQDTANEKRNK